MEKFSNWRDKGTGISPFYPVEVKVSAARKYVVNPVILALKWPFFVALYLFASVAPKAATRIIFRSLFSIADIDLLVEGVRKSNANETNAKKPSVGEVVVLNLVSPLDIFVIFLTSNVESLSSLVVVIPWKEDLYTFTAWEALSVLFQPLDSSITQGARLGGDARDMMREKLVVVFAEGSASNNKAILPLQPPCAQLWQSGDPPVKVAVLRYYPNGLSLPVPHMTKAQYVSRLLTLPSKAFVKVKIVPLRAASLKACQAAFVENGLCHVQLGVEEKLKFFEYFQDYSIKKEA
ncbi:hypothetical protein METBIDRAFT_42659 [Metschnikowia bicuspidata var. bicuspidata NRRL YB-4993]|uniref:Phospholipid/glycerol acyltransferase domain-containing protein n=1 Tax=Metschnikowia bicuspidata var. bicuspidata NRRL YB-4993 TaxID=869754 RepID=A0A1A0HC84_9ASCO|nr:hypothetical protein METBIDRAFT_42659 [Metschnikowia bicuspidata var. bicuspidata NRRL YB-4993]OBA21503.1 hypothetical protein METBIDRAFT_42659 [Metschnikowia bicuspidata var. bicuspidata NRRL YB-4993]